MLSQCYEERRSLATERAELSVLQKRALEREQRETQKSIQVKGRRGRGGGGGGEGEEEGRRGGEGGGRNGREGGMDILIQKILAHYCCL